VEPALKRRPQRRTLCTALASAGFVILIVGVTYFGMLVLAVHYGRQDERAAAYREIGLFLSGGHGWYRDARVYGAAALLCALASLLFGVSPLARITIPVAGACYVLLLFYDDSIRRMIERWAQSG